MSFLPRFFIFSPVSNPLFSCCLGFLIQSEASFDGWCELMKDVTRPPGGGATDYPMFSVSEEKASVALGEDRQGRERERGGCSTFGDRWRPRQGGHFSSL